MTDFTGGGIPNLDYDKDDVTIFNDTTEFTNDVFVYGKLYAEFGGDVQSFSTAGVERVRIDKDGQVTINSGDLLIKDNHKLDINNGALEFRGNNGGNAFITSTVGNLYIFTLDTGGDINNYAASNFSVFTNFNSERFTIDSGGQVIFKPMTETERDALTAVAGGVIYNSTTNKLQCYNGTTWNNLFWLTIFIHML